MFSEGSTKWLLVNTYWAEVVDRGSRDSLCHCYNQFLAGVKVPAADSGLVM